MLSAFRLSFFQWDLLTPQKFVGLRNFVTMVSDPQTINSYLRTLHFSVISVVAINVMAFVFALLFGSRLIQHKNLLQSLVFLPVILSIVAVGVVWEFMYQSTGIISMVTRTIFGASPAWLTSTAAAPYAIIITYVWKSVGYYMVIYIAGLLDVPSSLYEAARMDGAGFWAQLMYITTPVIRIRSPWPSFPASFSPSGSSPSNTSSRREDQADPPRSSPFSSSVRPLSSASSAIRQPSLCFFS